MIFHCFSSLFFNLTNFSWPIFQFTDSFLGYVKATSEVKNTVSESLFITVNCVFYLWHFHLILSYSFQLCCNCLSYLAYFFSIRVLNKLIIVILSSLSDSSNLCHIWVWFWELLYLFRLCFLCPFAYFIIFIIGIWPCCTKY